MCRNLTPSTAYLDHISNQVASDIAAVPSIPTHADDYSDQERLWSIVAQQAEDVHDELVDLSLDLHAHPEVAFEEHRSAAEIAKLLERHDFGVQRGIGGVETALYTEAMSENFDPEQHPTIAVLSEYDALPGIGHACGHNVIAACGIGGFLAAAVALEESGLPGRVAFIGTPAEEGHSGKEYLIRAGVFDSVDAAIMIHPFSYDIGSHVWVGRRNLSVTFHGVSAHASSEPFMGRNALDAATLAYQGLGLLRQQMPHSDRLHAIISEGGERASIIPDTATMSIYVRSLHTDTMLDLSQRVDDIIDGAALMAGVKVTKNWDVHPATLPVRNNETLVRRWQRTQARRGRTPLPSGVIPDTLAASTDFGNVSQVVPGMHPMVKIAPVGVALHTPGMEQAAASEAAATAILDSSIGLGQVAIDALAEPELLEEARQEFKARGAVVRSADLFGE
ncbi:p-aminobenzoyl-glutamate hydrolase subunit B [Corynebacterium kalinowskii]|uniref:Peptidase M20 domain-containing protein 2 n=1 Tax=Corynebacterium kalinowskii TaxID=2675216 RepID=A0A6B8VP35_9CORY|nr:M20 family metallopeptidase [Corynebacterium kalinowskii]QGU01561.1 p-aminobenzoyl-glutamate hydrolase subunit B [Corynebacterium kalinowskii]